MVSLSILEVKMNKPSFLLLLSLLISIKSNAALVDRIIAIVNSEIVLESDFNQLKLNLKKPGMVDESLIGNIRIEQLTNDKKLQLDYLINEKLVQAEIKKLSLSVTADRVDQEFNEMAKRNNMSSNDLAQAIKSQGVGLAEYKQFLKDKIEKQSLMDSEIIAKLRISDEEALTQYLKKNPDVKTTLDEFTVAHIFFSPKKGGDEAAKKRAELVLSKLRSGSSFETLAEQNSEDPNYKTGGLLGSFKSGEFLPEIEQSISSLAIDQTTTIIQSKIGYHIVKLISRKVTKDPKFEKEKEMIRSQLLEENFKKQLAIWLSNKKEEAYIHINQL